MSTLLLRLESDLLIIGFKVFRSRQYPNLKQVNGLRFRRVELAVHDSGSCGHHLNLIRSEYMPFTHAVTMQQLAFHDISHDLHVAMRVRSKSLSWGDAVLINDAQGAKAHLTRIAVIRE